MDNGNITRQSLPRRHFLQLLGGSSLFAAVPPLSQSAAPQSLPPNGVALSQSKRKGIVPPNKTYRMMEWECHTPPEGNFDIDIESALKAAQDAGAESMMFYSQDHWGHAFYPSEVAVRHPHLKGDLFGTEVSIARKLGMSVVCYYSLQFNNQAVLSHPDWGWVDAKGEQQRMRWFITCLDSPYRQYVLGMMNELFSRYEIDELFLDIFGIQFHIYHSQGQEPFCYCPHTETAWNQTHPGDPYREGFKDRQGWDRRYQWEQKRSMTLILDEIISAARKHRPNLLVSLNGGPEAFPNDIMQKVSFIYAEPLTSETGISLGSILMRGWGRPDYQAGVFSQQGYLDTYPGVLPRVKADSLIVQNARVFIVGNAPVVGGIDGQGFSKRWFAVAKETWADVRNVDHWLEGIQPVYSTAMLYSESTLDELAGQKRPVHFRRSVVGALEALTYSGRPVESIPEFRLTTADLSQFEALVLPEVEILSDQQAEVIRKWINNGGILLASGRCGLLDEKRNSRSNFPLADVFGVDLVSEERKYAYDQNGKLKEGVVSIYLESAGHPLATMLAVSTVGLPGPFLRLRRKSAEEVMRYRLPFMVEDMANRKWFNWGPPPPGKEGGGLAVAYNKFGRGQSLYLGVNLFQAMHEKLYWIRQWVPELMRQLLPRPIAELRSQTLSEYVHGTFFWSQDKRSVLVQILNAMELATNGEFRGVPKMEIDLDPSKLKVESARILWPKEMPLKVQSGNGKTQIVLSNPGRYTALRLELV